MPASRPRIDSGIVWLQTVPRKTPLIMSAAPGEREAARTSQMLGIRPARAMKPP